MNQKQYNDIVTVFVRCVCVCVCAHMYACVCECVYGKRHGGRADEASHWDTGRPYLPQAQLSAPPLTGFILIAQ